ncbi:winged helix-turn-helix transcriptional regulator [Xanthocytophaga flava]|uniref:winged helix-turn-helix transcriptional regulator n=1 Tax=Xanthocytophaga flava TaxID=3048013 RepID=UPI0028D8326A|nr:helix-turn-helix domain-containing protein [Xanthocytophaga flavus]MDJ1466976.1 helix-turn-helix domain-containing protein [Xanthocytophaga flavus]
MKLTDHTMIMDENCILHQSVMLLADKWTLLVLLSLIQGSKRTSDLLRQIGGISPKMLTQTLKKLEAAGIVERRVYPVIPPKVEYSLTETGKGLEEVLSTLYKWSVRRVLANS